MKLLILLCWSSILCAGTLQDDLHDKLAKGETTMYSPVELALIAGGADSPDALKNTVEQYQELYADLMIPEKMMNKKSKKKARELHDKMWQHFRQADEVSYRLQDLWEKTIVSRLTATFLLADMAQAAGLVPEDYADDDKPLEPYFFSQTEVDLKEVAAGIFTKKAAVLCMEDEVDSADIAGALEVSSMLAPDSEYGTNLLDNMIYERIYKLYTEKTPEALRAGARIAAAACQRFPNQADFKGLACNFGILLIQETDQTQNYREALDFADLLYPHVGEHQKLMDRAVSLARFNLAIELYEAKNFEDAMVEAEKINTPPDEDDYQTLLMKTYEQVVESRLNKGDQKGATEVLEKMEAKDPSRVPMFKIRLKQKGVLEMTNEAYFALLDDAAANVDTDKGKARYLFVLNQYLQGYLETGEYLQALGLLDRVPDVLSSDPALYDFRFKTYASWIEANPEDFQTRVRLFKKAYSDPLFKMKPDDRKLFDANYGMTYHKEIERLVGEDKFKEAAALSNTALKALPNHEELLKQKQWIQQILDRLGE